MVLSKKHKLLLVCVSLLMLGGSITYIFYGTDKNTTKKPVVKQEKRDPRFDKKVAEQATTDIRQYIEDDETYKIYELIQQKDYDGAIKNSVVRCPILTGTPQVICYGLYVQALEEKNSIAEIAKLAGEVLELDSIKNDITAKNVWTFIRDTASKGINPKNAIMESNNPEASS